MRAPKRQVTIIILVAMLCFSLANTRLYAQNKEKKKNGFIVIPALFYTPETKVAGGLSVISYFRGNRPLASRPSIIQPTFIYTQKKQITSSLVIEHYLFKDAYRLNLETAYKKYPDSFFGIGPKTRDSMEEQFTPKIFELDATVYKRLSRKLHYGLTYQFRHDRITEVEPAGLLAEKKIAGSEGGQSSGIGFSINLDTRDNIFYPVKGKFLQTSITFFSDILASDFNFSYLVFDLRNYHTLRNNTVFAVQGYAGFIAGTAPFQLLSQFGGEDIMRGYYEGRYRDKHALVVQTEVRQNLFWRFGVAGFLGAGQVAGTLSQVNPNNTKLSAGFGFRFRLSENEGINGRFDLGLIGGSLGPYITINEAF